LRPRLLAAFIAREVLTSYVAYTADESDLVSLAPQVTGRIVSVQVSDNQDVTEGDLLATIDPVPFQLALDQRRAEASEAHAQAASDRDRIASARDVLAAATSAAGYARETQVRLTTLATAQDVSRVDLDQANDALRRANAARDAAEEAVAAAKSMLSMAPGRGRWRGGRACARRMAIGAHETDGTNQWHRNLADASRRRHRAG
jgi:multidrug efflux system membrane fusion protein